MFQVPSSNKLLIFHSSLFTDYQWQEPVFEKCVKSGDKKLTAEKGNLLADHRGNAVTNFFKSIFIVKQVVLLFSGINGHKCTKTQGTFQSGLWKSELQRF